MDDFDRKNHRKKEGVDRTCAGHGRQIHAQLRPIQDTGAARSGAGVESWHACWVFYFGVPLRRVSALKKDAATGHQHS
jgi:hypothetical protein